MVSKEELEIAHDYIINIFLIKTIEYDIKVIQASQMKTKNINAAIYEKMLSTAINDRRQIRNKMNKFKLKVEEETRDTDFINYVIYSKNGDHQAAYFVMKIKNDCMKWIKNYFGMEN